MCLPVKRALQGEAVKFPASSIEHPVRSLDGFNCAENLVSFGEMTDQTLIIWENSFVWVSGDVVLSA